MNSGMQIGDLITTAAPSERVFILSSISGSDEASIGAYELNTQRMHLCTAESYIPLPEDKVESSPTRALMMTLLGRPCRERDTQRTGIITTVVYRKEKRRNGWCVMINITGGAFSGLLDLADICMEPPLLIPNLHK